MFVASAGAYAADSVEPMHVEGDKRKASAGRLFGGGGGGALGDVRGRRQGQGVHGWVDLGGGAGQPPSLPLPPTLSRPPSPPPLGHVVVEEYLVSQGLPYTVFQPLYIYGPETSKDCEQWFMERVMRWVGGAPHGAPHGAHVCSACLPACLPACARGV